MKFTLSWLKEFLDTNATPEEISAKLTAIGLEVESMENPGERIAAFTVAEITDAQPHPDADKLRVCQVLTHDGQRQIVCGAPNARAGIKVILADIGVTVPRDGFQIKKAKIRGVESNGMLCSADELGLGKDSAGIVELPADAKIGTPVAEVLGLNDVLYDINITPNRGDCLGVYGVARDLAAAGLGALKPLNTEPVAGKGDAGRKIHLHTEDCKLFVGRQIRNVINGESPDWLKKRLESVGLRPISALVDITNYMTVAYGRPLHVYDADKLSGDIIVRTSQDGEALEALNDKAYTLLGGLCVIADSAAALGLGGVIGGTPSSVTEHTKNVFLESAWFEPEAIARTGRTLQIDSDARYRFERTVDPLFTQTGAEIATRMIMALCGGEASTLEISGAAPLLHRQIVFALDEIETLGGVVMEDEEASTILEALGCDIEMGFDGWNISTPSWRPDIEDKADLVEELLRIKGYDAITECALPAMQGMQEEHSLYGRARAVRRGLAMHQGLKECCHFAFVARAQAERFKHNAPLIGIINPISAELDTMRPSLLPGLLLALAKGAARGMQSNALFEVGVTFSGIYPEAQLMNASGVRMGTQPAHWSGKPRAWDVYDVRADLETALQAAGFSGRAQISQGAAPWYHPGKAGTLTLGKTVLGYFGALHPSIVRFFDLEGEVMAFECFLEAVPAARKKASRAALKLSDFQPSVRDFAFVLDAGVPAEELLNVVRGCDKELIRDVTLFDVYAGKGIPEGKKSLALSVTLQAENRTLTEDDLTRVSGGIILAAEKKCGAQLR